MKIFIDINHPAHVHYFRNFIRIMEGKGHKFVITNRDSKIINELLDYFQIKHFIRNRRLVHKYLLSSIFYLFGAISFCLKKAFQEKPDIYIGFSSFPSALTAFVFRKPAILLDDTEHNKINHKLNNLVGPVILTPFYFKKNLGNKQLYFHAYVEQFYLHSKYYKPNDNVLNELGLVKFEYALVRYIAYDARHDNKVQPLSEEFKRKIVLELSKKIKVLISSESDDIDEFYTPFQVKFSPEKMHDVIAHAALFLSEGATMASEACVLGVPCIYINPLQEVGNITEQVKTYPKVASKSAEEGIILNLLHEKLANRLTLENRLEIKETIEQTTINPTAFFVWFVENYPESLKIMNDNSDYQCKF